MWWKIYFWINVVLLICAFIGYGTFPSWTIRDVVDIIGCIMGLLGLYAFVYKKMVFTPMVWKWYFWISMAMILIDLGHLYSGLYTLPPYLFAPEVTQLKGIYIPLLLLCIPTYYAIYCLAYPEKAPARTKASKSTKKRKK